MHAWLKQCRAGEKARGESTGRELNESGGAVSDEGGGGGGGGGEGVSSLECRGMQQSDAELAFSPTFRT